MWFEAYAFLNVDAVGRQFCPGGKRQGPGWGIITAQEKVVETDTGEKVKGVFPVFDSTFEVHLPDELLKAKDKEQFAECNKQLSKAIENDPELKEKFSTEQIEQIKNGDTPDGYVWHHNEEKGKMELVDFKTHSDTRHTGGKSIWGGGSEYRWQTRYNHSQGEHNERHYLEIRETSSVHG